MFSILYQTTKFLHVTNMKTLDGDKSDLCESNLTSKVRNKGINE